MDEERVQLLAARMRPVLAATLSPDAAGSKALALAFLVVQAESELDAIPASDDALIDQMQGLPEFVEAEWDRGSMDDMATLVRRFVQGERPQLAPTQRTSAVAQRRVRLHELQRGGVDLSLIEMTLAQTPLQRIANMERQLRFVRRLQQARREQEAGR